MLPGNKDCPYRARNQVALTPMTGLADLIDGTYFPDAQRELLPACVQTYQRTGVWDLSSVIQRTGI